MFKRIKKVFYVKFKIKEDTSMSKLYKFTKEAINAVVEQNKMGNYVLYKIINGEAIAKYVGRATTGGLQERLKAHIDEGDKYDGFSFSYAGTEKQAFEKECRLYHDFGGNEGKLNNKIHPSRPEGKDWECPCCTIFD